MPFYTPLRYPGGKRRLATTVMRLLEANGLKNVHYAEPYAGGAAIAFALLLEEYASTITINDLSRPVYAFWHTVLNDTADLCRRVVSVRVTMREWRRQRAIYERRDTAELSELGFAALFLNRTNRSGIIAGGVIGGQDQKGAWPIHARFNKDELVHRIRRIGRYRNRINLYGLDALLFSNQVLPQLGSKAFVFYDPPYIENGEKLYLNDYSPDDHRRLAARVSRLEQPWVVTYDYAAIGANLYPSHRRMVYRLPYSAQSRHRAREVMFLSDRLRLPPTWTASRPVLLTPKSSRYPLRGRIETPTPRPRAKNAPASR
jgi:DNA adenine methylase